MNVKNKVASALLGLSIALTACGSPTQNQPLSDIQINSLSAPNNLANTLLPSYPEPRFTVNEAELFYDLNTFKAMQDLVDRAQKSIKIDYYIFGGPTAKILATKLINKFKAGVKVNIILDRALGSVPEMKGQTQPILKMLKDARIPLTFNSQKGIPPVQKDGTVDHNKYFVIDDNEALIGSMNLADKFYNYHDLMIHVKGPAAVDLSQQFDFDWYYANNPDAQPPTGQVHLANSSEALPDNSVRLVGTGLGRKTGFESILNLIKNAQKSIYIQMHEIGPGDVLTAIFAANKRGIDVKIIIDPGNIDPFIPVIHYAPKGIINAVALDQMLKEKINVHTYRVSEAFTTAHMKSCVIDDNILFAGSTNWTKGGFEWVNETNLEIHGGKAVQQAAKMFMSDWNNQSDASKPPSAAALLLGKTYQYLF